MVYLNWIGLGVILKGYSLAGSNPLAVVNTK